jgi:hypothetical protein
MQNASNLRIHAEDVFFRNKNDNIPVLSLWNVIFTFKNCVRLKNHIKTDTYGNETATLWRLWNALINSFQELRTNYFWNLDVHQITLIIVLSVREYSVSEMTLSIHTDCLTVSAPTYNNMTIVEYTNTSLPAADEYQTCKLLVCLNWFRYFCKRVPV